MQSYCAPNERPTVYTYVFFDVFVEEAKAQLAGRVTSNLGKAWLARLWWRPVASLGVAARDFDLLRLIAAFPTGSTACMDTPETPEAPADAPWNPQYVAIAILIVVVPVVLWRRRGGSSEDDNYETDESGRRRKIMHGDL